VLSHWLSERRTLRQGFVALGICTSVTLVAGVILGAMEGLLARQPGLLILIPSAIGMRGAIFGALGARLGTGMLTGQFTLAPERRSFTGQNVEAAALLTLVTAGLSAVLARTAAGLVGITTIDLWQLTLISTVGAVLSSGVVLVVVLALARTAERRSWDMDAIGTPIISATADISTLPALVVGTLLLGSAAVRTVLGAACLAAAAAALVLGVRNAGDLTRRVVQESLPVLGYAALMGVLAGTVLSEQLETLVTSPALLVAIPPFIATCGAIGGILSARLSSQLHLGLLSPRALPERPAGLEGTLSIVFGVVGFATVGLLTQVASSVVGFASPGVAELGGITVTGGLLAVGVLFMVAYYAATSSYRFGLDPDNYSIPIVTATMDFMGILCLVAGITLFGGP
jgi:mgtE-like transporter